MDINKREKQKRMDESYDKGNGKEKHEMRNKLEDSFKENQGKKTWAQTIVELWNTDKLPMLSGLLKSDHTFYELTDGNELESSTEPDFSTISDIECLVKMASLSGEGFLIFAGEGSWGSDGWILALTSAKEFCWLFSGEINPIVELKYENHMLFAYNNNHIQFQIPLDSPENTKIV